MKLREILGYIPKEQLRMFALEYQVDRQVKKLSGEVMFYLLLFSSLNVRHNSLRTLEQFYSSPTFTGLFDKPIKHAKYNSISDRLRTINADYFKAIFESVLSRYSDSYLKPRDNIIAFDSTIVTLSSKLLKTGMKVGELSGCKRNQVQCGVFERTGKIKTVYATGLFLGRCCAQRADCRISVEPG
ncbi:hypothetical protein [Aggregatibacter actinomycetemcomitans]|uniref:hypothetical protein n=1 Tax=Aggregatibacter actinomycetemcomitans TaxID=714 RepID=UPI001E4F65E9|nr:hypothetical protein [Aggregatibacter actinomycetemcomitans]